MSQGAWHGMEQRVSRSLLIQLQRMSGQARAQNVYKLFRFVRSRGLYAASIRLEEFDAAPVPSELELASLAESSLFRVEEVALSLPHVERVQRRDERQRGNRNGATD